MGTFFAKFVGNFDGEYADYNDLMVLSGMSAALGSLFPSPILSTMMMIEIGHPPRLVHKWQLMYAVDSKVVAGNNTRIFRQSI